MIEVIARPGGEINVDRRPRLSCVPRGHEQSALQYKAICQRVLAEPIEKSLHREVLQQFLKGTVSSLRLIQQPLPNRGRDIAAHSMASMYGSMIVLTRQTSA